MTAANEKICNIVHGPIPKNILVNKSESKETIKPSQTPIFKVMIKSKAVIGWMFGKKGKAKAKRPTVVRAVKIASSEIR